MRIYSNLEPSNIVKSVYEMADVERPDMIERLGLEKEKEWLVAPVILTSSSHLAHQSTFACYLARLGGESDDVQVHRFEHYGITSLFRIRS